MKGKERRHFEVTSTRAGTTATTLIPSARSAHPRRMREQWVRLLVICIMADAYTVQQVSREIRRHQPNDCYPHAAPQLEREGLVHSDGVPRCPTRGRLRGHRSSDHPPRTIQNSFAGQANTATSTHRSTPALRAALAEGARRSSARQLNEWGSTERLSVELHECSSGLRPEPRPSWATA